jgi:hypothetical protein
MSDLERFRDEYERIRAAGIPYRVGETEWPDRLRSWDDFQEFGPLVVEMFRELVARERSGDILAKGQPERLRKMAPELFELLMRAFPADSRPDSTD